MSGRTAPALVRGAWLSLLGFVVSAPAALVVPAVAAWVLGRRAADAGDARGWTPALLGALVAGLFVLVNVVSGIAVLAA